MTADGSVPSEPVALEIDAAATANRLEAFRVGQELLLDCREPDEHATARIEGARLIPMREIAERLAELEPWRNAPIVVHCHHGMRSLRVATWLRQQGFERATSMKGGIDAWSTEVDPGVPRY